MSCLCLKSPLKATKVKAKVNVILLKSDSGILKAQYMPGTNTVKIPVWPIAIKAKVSTKAIRSKTQPDYENIYGLIQYVKMIQINQYLVTLSCIRHFYTPKSSPRANNVKVKARVIMLKSYS
jgi:hypothetical protein